MPEPLKIDPENVPTHTFQGFTELPVGFHERALAAGLGRAAILEAAEVHDPATDRIGAVLDIVPVAQLSDVVAEQAAKSVDEVIQPEPSVEPVKPDPVKSAPLTSVVVVPPAKVAGKFGK